MLEYFTIFFKKLTHSRLTVMSKLVCDFFPVKINHFRVGKNRQITLHSDTYLNLCPVTVTHESADRILHITDSYHK